ncbi:P-loop NTPase fold protein [Marinifilum fragile]|uniref:KAP family P-loop NTPase fold protein n=1 Tax=Marinifilum fragile TaxID=570161 RepID=UPI002AA883AF|nr:P-loop NTPase fold protein [Marinifilum fragile]
MTKQTQANHMNLKSIAKFWQFTLLFFLALIVFNELLFKLYEGIYKTLFLNDIGIFLILTVLFAFLFWELIGQIKAKTQVVWKLRDAFITAALIKSLWLIIWAFITLSIVPLSYFNFIDYSIYKWISSNPFKNIHLIIAFVYCAGIYLALKYYYWDAKTKQINSVQRNKKESFELNDDRTLGETEAFLNCTTLEELKEQDKLGRFDYAQQISHIIINNGENKAFAIGINGDWGSGKTSFIDMIKRINGIEYSEQCIFINFNPWYFTGTEKVLKKFYDTLIKTVGNNFSITFRNDLSKYFELICATESKIWKTNFLQYFKNNTDFESQLNDLKAHFEELPQKIVIIIDDLDRLQKDEILVLFRTIRLIADFPNVVYLVGYSHKYVNDVIIENHKTNEEQASFMEKIFQLEFELPEPIPNDLKIFWKSKIAKFIPADSSGLQVDIINKIVDNNILPNLRDIKRFINQLSINSSLPEVKNNTYQPQFFLLELIFYYDSEAHYTIRKSRSLDIKTYQNSDEEIDEGTIKLIDQIKKLDKNTTQSIVDPKHFDKYFFKRLDRQRDIDFHEVKSLFTDPNYEKRFRKLYHISDISQTQIIDHILKFVESFENNYNEFDKANWKQYMDRIFFLFEYIYTSERYDKNYFKKGASVREQRLIKGISIICKLISTGNFSNEIAYFQSKLDNKSFSDFLLIFAKENKELNPIFYKVSELFRDKIRDEIEMHSIDTMCTIISLYNYSKFLKLGKYGDYVYSDEAILNGLRERSKMLYSDIKKLDDGISILDIFCSKENLLKLNDLKSQGIFKMLDDLRLIYPFHKKNKIKDFTYSFDYSNYNYNINIPKSIEEITIMDSKGNAVCRIDNINKKQLTVCHIELNGNRMSEERKLSRQLHEDLTIQLYKVNSGIKFQLRDRRTELGYEEFKSMVIDTNPFISFQVNILTKNNEDFVIERELMSDHIMTDLNKLNSN